MCNWLQDKLNAIMKLYTLDGFSSDENRDVNHTQNRSHTYDQIEMIRHETAGSKPRRKKNGLIAYIALENMTNNHCGTNYRCKNQAH